MWPYGGDASHLPPKQHETWLFVVKSYSMWVSGGRSIYIDKYIHTYIYRDTVKGVKGKPPNKVWNLLVLKVQNAKR